MTTWQSKAMRGYLTCPDCGDQGPHETNEMRRFSELSLLCRGCGFVFDVDQSPEAEANAEPEVALPTCDVCGAEAGTPCLRDVHRASEATTAAVSKASALMAKGRVAEARALLDAVTRRA